MAVPGEVCRNISGVIVQHGLPLFQRVFPITDSDVAGAVKQRNLLREGRGEGRTIFEKTGNPISPDVYIEAERSMRESAVGTH